MAKEKYGLIFRSVNPSSHIYFMVLDFFEDTDTYHVLMFDAGDIMQYDRLTMRWLNNQTSKGALEEVDLSKLSKNQEHILYKVIAGIFEILHGNDRK